MVATINELTARGFVVRAPDPGDRRRNAITITDEGRRHLKDLDVLIAGAEGEFLAPLSDAERAELIRILKLIVYGHGSLAAVLCRCGFPVDDDRVGVGPDPHRHPGSWE
jgi:hypothetical protein